jgi:hypothetical protein
MALRATLLAGAIGYATLVFLGMAGLGFVVAPAIGRATHLFPIETEADAVFSLLTLKAVPALVGLSTAAAFSYQWVMGLSISHRVVVYCATVILAWVTGAAIAAVMLG